VRIVRRCAKRRVSGGRSFSAILGIAVGIVLLLWPLSGVLSLTLVLIVFFVIEGVASIMFALEHKRAVGTMGLDAGERHRRPDLGRHHFRRPAWHRSLGYRAAGRHQYGVRRFGADRDGAACPRDRSAFGCPGALSETALIGNNLIRENVRGRASSVKLFAAKRVR
jgi:hypothetical protein